MGNCLGLLYRRGFVTTLGTEGYRQEETSPRSGMISSFSGLTDPGRWLVRSGVSNRRHTSAFGTDGAMLA